MQTKDILQKGITFKDLLDLVREFSGKTDNEIAQQVFFDLTNDASRKIVNVLLEHNYRLVTGKV